MVEIIADKLNKMESLYREQWSKLSQISKNGNLELLIQQTEALKKTYAKIITLEVLYGECITTDINSKIKTIGWYSVEDQPLFITKENGIWVCTEYGEREFIAAVPYYDSKSNEKLWWIRHCVIEDEIGLCVVGDDDNEPAGWTLKDITHWMPISSPSK